MEVSVPQHSPSASDTFELQIDQRHYQLTLPKTIGIVLLVLFAWIMFCFCCQCLQLVSMSDVGQFTFFVLCCHGVRSVAVFMCWAAKSAATVYVIHKYSHDGGIVTVS